MDVWLALLGGGFLGTVLTQLIEASRVRRRRQEDRAHSLADARLLRRQEAYTEALSATVSLRILIGDFEGALMMLTAFGDHLESAPPGRSPEQRAEDFEKLAALYRGAYDVAGNLEQRQRAAGSAAWKVYALAPEQIQEACVLLAASPPHWQFETRIRYQDPASDRELKVSRSDVHALAERLRPRFAETARRCLALEDLLREALGLDAEDRLEVTRRRWSLRVR